MLCKLWKISREKIFANCTSHPQDNRVSQNKQSVEAYVVVNCKPFVSQVVFI